MKNKSMNNKGFSLVELIVVMAIMAILAVTLAPRLTHYIDKARGASDQQVVSTIYNATKLSLADPSLSSAYKTLAGASSDDVNLIADSVYNKSADGTSWTAVTSTNAFATELQTVVGNFTLKSNKVGANTAITIEATSGGAVTVTLDYDTTAPGDNVVVPE